MTGKNARSVCFYSVATHLGGGERSLLELVRGLTDRPELGYRPWVLLPKAEGPLISQLKQAGVDFDILPIPRSFFEMSRGAPLSAFRKSVRSIPGMSFYFMRLIYLMRKKQPALMHTNGIKCHALAALAGPAIGAPVLWHLRDIIDEGPTLWTLRALYRGVGIRAVANSLATAQAFLPKAPSKVGIVHNGLDPNRYFRKPHRAFHEEFGLDPNVPLVGLLGVLARWKGQVEFIEMAARLIRGGSNAHFAVIGGEIYDTHGKDRGYGKQLEDQAEKLGIRERVHFAGFREDPAQAINGLDVLVHASVKPEPFGRVIVEAMACGVPVVASAAGGVFELISHGETGLLYDSGSVEGMAEAIEKLLKSPELRESLSKEAERAFFDRFTQAKHVEGISSLYDSILETSRR